jgi:hypothetical protein
MKCQGERVLSSFVRMIPFVAMCLSFAAAAVEQQASCAIVSDSSLKDSPVPALLPDKLSGGNLRFVEFVERDEVAKVLAEQKLPADGESARWSGRHNTR